MKRALLLNADWTPMHFVDEDEAIYLLYLNKAEMVIITDGQQSKWPKGHGLANGGEFPAGATLRLLEHVKKRWKPPQFRKRVMFNRDNWQCQYCGAAVNSSTATIEHIVPESRGGPKSWLNCVTACTHCNRRKMNRTPDEAGMTLRSVPKVPAPIHYWDIQRSSEWHPDWDYLLGKQ
jgi:hypothetical protein